MHHGYSKTQGRYTRKLKYVLDRLNQKNHPNIPILDLSHIPLSQGQLAEIQQHLLSFDIVSLNISQTNLTPSHCQKIATIISQSTTLRALNLSQNYLHAPELIPICDAITTHPSLETVNFSQNYIDAETCSHIANFLKRNPNITTLHIHSTYPNTEGCKQLIAGFARCLNPINVFLDRRQSGEFEGDERVGAYRMFSSYKIGMSAEEKKRRIMMVRIHVMARKSFLLQHKLKLTEMCFEIVRVYFLTLKQEQGCVEKVLDMREVRKILDFAWTRETIGWDRCDFWDYMDGLKGL